MFASQPLLSSIYSAALSSDKSNSSIRDKRIDSNKRLNILSINAHQCSESLAAFSHRFPNFLPRNGSMQAIVNHSWAKVLGFRLAQLPIKQEDKGSMNGTSLMAIYLSEDAVSV